MFRFIKKCFFIGSLFLSSLVRATPLGCISVNNQVCKVRPESLHFNEVNSYLFVNGTDIYKFKARDSEIVASPLFLGKISKGWSTDNMKKTGFNGYVYDFSVDYDATFLTINIFYFFDHN